MTKPTDEEIVEAMKAVIFDEIRTAYEKNWRWEDAKDLVEEIDCGPIANAALAVAKTMLAQQSAHPGLEYTARQLAHEAYDRFVMGGWEAEDFVKTIVDWARLERDAAVRIAQQSAPDSVHVVFKETGE